jgi:hypothetical protein
MPTSAFAWEWKLTWQSPSRTERSQADERLLSYTASRDSAAQSKLMP